MKTIIPTHGKILVEERLTAKEFVTKAGIAIPENQIDKFEKPRGKVVAVANPVRTIKGDLIEPDAQIGDIAVYSKTTKCIPIENEGKNYLLVPAADVHYYEREKPKYKSVEPRVTVVKLTEEEEAKLRQEQKPVLKEITSTWTEQDEDRLRSILSGNPESSQQ